MTMLVSVNDAKYQLRIDSSDDDEGLDLYVKAASAAVLNYIRSGDPAFLDSAGAVIEDSEGIAIGVPVDIKTATLYLVGVLYRDRDGEKAKDWEHGYLPTPVVSLLYPYRLPALA